MFAFEVLRTCVNLKASTSRAICTCVRLNAAKKSTEELTFINEVDRYTLFGSKDSDSKSKSKRCEVTASTHLKTLFKQNEAKNIVAALDTMAEKEMQPYTDLLHIAANSTYPEMPSQFEMRAGWTKYSTDGNFETVPFPPDKVLVFDVEVCVRESMAPVLAVAASPNAWYSWCSDRLVSKHNEVVLSSASRRDTGYKLNELIDLGPSDLPRMLIGHNVGYDRARIAQQYHIKDWMHVWKARTSRNSLLMVHQLHCPLDTPINKDDRRIFEKGTIHDVREDFQNLMRYCAHDVLATAHVHKQLWPKFTQKFNSAITHFGMVELGTSCLPVTNNWRRFVSTATECTKQSEQKAAQIVADRANTWRHKWLTSTNKREYEKDPWMFDLNWTETSMLFNGQRHKVPAWYRSLMGSSGSSASISGTRESEDDSVSIRARVVPKLLQMCWNGHPLYFDPARHCWAYLHCVWPKSTKALAQSIQHELVSAEVHAILKTIPPHRIPLVEIAKTMPEMVFEGDVSLDKRLDSRLSLSVDCKHKPAPDLPYSTIENERMADIMHAYNGLKLYARKLLHPDGASKNVGNPLSRHMLHWIESGVLGAFESSQAQQMAELLKQSVYWHANQNRLDQQLTVWHNIHDQDQGLIVPQLLVAGTVTRRASEKLWMTVSNPKKGRIGSELKSLIEAPVGYKFVGADVDSQEQWIASVLGDSYLLKQQQNINQILELDNTIDCKPGQTAFSRMLLLGRKEDGSDLHSVVASELGVSRDQAKVLNYGRLYGAGAPFASTLLNDYLPQANHKLIKDTTTKLYNSTKGKRTFDSLDFEFPSCSSFLKLSDSPELELATAAKELLLHMKKTQNPFKTSWIKVDDGAVLIQLGPCKDKMNRDRFLELLGQLPRLSSLTEENRRAPKTQTDARRLSHSNVFKGRVVTQWMGGFESEVFNCLEQLALTEYPRTPILGSALSDALTLPKHSTGYESFVSALTTSRVNWVVQSSAADFLHILLLCMTLLTKHIQARFSLSVHDEIRYLCREEDVKECARALHLSNLCARAYCSLQLGVTDLPESVAFFSQVDVDRVLRKEPHDDAITPSNAEGLSVTYGIPPGYALTYKDCAN